VTRYPDRVPEKQVGGTLATGAPAIPRNAFPFIQYRGRTHRAIGSTRVGLHRD